MGFVVIEGVGALAAVGAFGVANDSQLQSPLPVPHLDSSPEDSSPWPAQPSSLMLAKPWADARIETRSVAEYITLSGFCKHEELG